MKKPVQPSTSGDTEIFVLTFEDIDDPSQEQTAEVMDQLSSFDTREVIPGTIQIVGQPQDVEKAASDLKTKKWNLSRERSLSSNPPHKSRIE